MNIPKINAGNITTGGNMGTINPTDDNIGQNFAGAMLNIFNPDRKNQLAAARQDSLNQAQFERNLYADSTKVQRSMQDLKAAGLNPVLAAGGSAGSAGSGSSGGASGNDDSGNILGLLNSIFSFTNGLVRNANDVAFQTKKLDNSSKMLDIAAANTKGFDSKQKTAIANVLSKMILKK